MATWQDEHWWLTELYTNSTLIFISFYVSPAIPEKNLFEKKKNHNLGTSWSESSKLEWPNVVPLSFAVCVSVEKVKTTVNNHRNVLVDTVANWISILNNVNVVYLPEKYQCRLAFQPEKGNRIGHKVELEVFQSHIQLPIFYFDSRIKC